MSSSTANSDSGYPRTSSISHHTSSSNENSGHCQPVNTSRHNIYHRGTFHQLHSNKHIFNQRLGSGHSFWNTFYLDNFTAIIHGVFDNREFLFHCPWIYFEPGVAPSAVGQLNRRHNGDYHFTSDDVNSIYDNEHIAVDSYFIYYE
ncbi:hypothetical protein VSDG_05751 [Cytospora chrysosperma]|uniref:Uncharacterized protein n=1 Tax=Cytospora chrysosperma TaxID=252740 RepID=A0A423VTB3_CYTCH|nr:hypothetical protein VSDG_05751 [Valsa sordida]